mmetsp:Transcript_37889/g.108958  ORF Transcript_37889/g.108958 Transcript_37889/m.108958 type:complete len:201 (-) Transcript_37889:709-1311(-)
MALGRRGLDGHGGHLGGRAMQYAQQWDAAVHPPTVGGADGRRRRWRGAGRGIRRRMGEPMVGRRHLERERDDVQHRGQSGGVAGLVRRGRQRVAVEAGPHMVRRAVVECGLARRAARVRAQASDRLVGRARARRRGRHVQRRRGAGLPTVVGRRRRELERRGPRAPAAVDPGRHGLSASARLGAARSGRLRRGARDVVRL